MTRVITSICIDVNDSICTTVCPVDRICEGERIFYIHPTECIECGMCETKCPVDAKRFADEVEEAQRAFLAINAAAFRDSADTLLKPGGWLKGDEPLKDPPGLARLAGHYLRKDAL